MNLKFLYPYWGKEDLNPKKFIDFTKNNGFDGIEINLLQNEKFERDFEEVLYKERSENSDFICVLQQVFGIKKESSKEYLNKVLLRLNKLAHFKPNFINSHTGKDHYSFSENCRIIEAIENFSINTNIPVYHEIHRGRFTFHSTGTLKYLEVFPELKLVGDLSHWCVVSESLLQDQTEIIQKVIPHIRHLHARVATEQASQINDPFAPEWTKHLEIFTNLWKDIVAHKRNAQWFTITPEFGPYPYMPQTPFTEKPLADQDALNKKMKHYLETVLV